MVTLKSKRCSERGHNLAKAFRVHIDETPRNVFCEVPWMASLTARKAQSDIRREGKGKHIQGAGTEHTACSVLGCKEEKQALQDAGRA